jgi:Zn-dependent metalloprotease
MTSSAHQCRIIPPYLLERIARSHPDNVVRERVQATLQQDTRIRALRASVSGPVAAGQGAFEVYDAHQGTDLPGGLVRSAGDPPSGEAAVDEAYAGVGATLSLYQDVYERASYDGNGAKVVSTVHFDQNYDNAFWNGTQLVFGDGDGQIFLRFTKPIDVIGHEFTHAVTQYTAGLTYEGQSGALNESVSDVFGTCVKQRVLGQDVTQADWLIGVGILAPGVSGRALRSMMEPGTAYDDDVLGKDPQVGSMADYVDTTEDNGGVHINSGIPNRAFALAATSIGGNAWDGAGRIWYSALTSGVGSSTDFADFADATITAAQAVSTEATQAVIDAWTTVGVTVSAPRAQ